MNLPSLSVIKNTIFTKLSKGMNLMATVSQEKLILDALKIAKELDADYPRYVTLIMAMNTLIGWMDGLLPTVWINQNNDRWITLSYEGRLKDRDYLQLFRDENLCLLRSETEKMNIEVKHCGYQFQASAGSPPTNHVIRKNELPDCEKDASSVTIAYQIGSDNRKIDEEKVKSISSYFCNRFPGLTVCFCGCPILRD